MTKVAYVKHPVSAELKKQINEEGYKIIDARFAPDDAEIIDPHKVEEPGNPANPLTREDIDEMERDGVIELLKAHGVEDPKGKVDALRAQLKSIVFTDL